MRKSITEKNTPEEKEERHERHKEKVLDPVVSRAPLQSTRRRKQKREKKDMHERKTCMTEERRVKQRQSTKSHILESPVPEIRGKSSENWSGV